MKPISQTTEYRCPDEEHPISRAVHLGRLARFYPPCRQCRHRDDTGTLSGKQIQRLVETRSRGLMPPLFHEEGAGGVFGNRFTADVARDLAAAFGTCLRQRLAPAKTSRPDGAADDPAEHPERPSKNDSPLPREGEGSHCWTAAEVDSANVPANRTPVVILGGDGRPIGAELVAALGEGARFSGCRLIDVGPASAPCLAFAVDHLGTDGGILLGNTDGRPHTVSLKFWTGGPEPLSAGGSLDVLKRAYAAGIDRPTRTFGALRRFQADVPYLAVLSQRYHALRPLRVVLHTTCSPLIGYLERLTGPVACRIVPCRADVSRLPELVLAEQAHLGACVEDDGERCRVLDDLGRPVSVERLLLLVVRHLLVENPDAPIVLEAETPPEVARWIETAGGRGVRSGARRSEMFAAMRQHRALVGGGPSGRFWYDFDGTPLPDALTTLTLLLVLLSQSDRRFSEVLDRDGGTR